MSEAVEKYKHTFGSGYFDIQWKGNRTHKSNNKLTHADSTDLINEYNKDKSHQYLLDQDRVFEEPVFYYLQSFVYYIVYCSYKPRGKENWKKGATYLEEIAEHLVSTPDWQTNMGVDFLSPASHPKSGPMNVHPASLNYFLRQSFLRTDFDFTGNRPKDIVVPYYVEYTENPQQYVKNASSSGSGTNSARDSKTDNGAISPFDLIKSSKNKGLRNRNMLSSNRGWGSARAESLVAASLDSVSSDKSTSVAIPTTSSTLSAAKSTLILFVGSRNPLQGLREELETAFQRSVDRNLYTDIVYTTVATSHETYKHLLFNAEFCLCVRGDTASSGRLFSVIEAGCIPVLISDWLQLPFESLIDYSQFTLSFPERIVHNVEHLIDYLRFMSEERKTRMRQALKDVRPLLLYETSRSDLFALNPVTLSLVEALLTRKRYCDALSSEAVSPMCSKIARRLQVAAAVANGSDLVQERR
eukprot:gene21906-27983_t